MNQALLRERYVYPIAPTAAFGRDACFLHYRSGLAKEMLKYFSIEAHDADASEAQRLTAVESLAGFLDDMNYSVDDLLREQEVAARLGL